MEYAYTKQTSLSYEEAVDKTKNELKNEGFGVLTEIDVKKTLKEKLAADYDRYIILGACNPPFAYEALKAEKSIGLMLPCNVVVYEDAGKTFVSTIRPTVAMGKLENGKLKSIAAVVEAKLKRVIDAV